ncbi:uncharacterized protein LOC120354819 [Nilaparvata lugens]|uniref:uncharacterized protein LOC120354819 n=1 Tax=Nilaparvata lugens TaxID=108931 RepID=UPI00193DEDBE|nr:uncharacterized protein LOC120354819 [Nilaparvata lugens]
MNETTQVPPRNQQPLNKRSETVSRTMDNTCDLGIVVYNVAGLRGADILLALKNAVSAYPRLEGRFPQVTGVSFGFDPTAPPGQRVDASLVRVGDEYPDPNHKYLLAIKPYLHSGCDGYTGLKQATVVIRDLRPYF